MSASSTRALSVAAALIFLAGVPSLACAQAAAGASLGPDSTQSWYRDPQTAATLGTFIPGAGHIYAAGGIVLLNDHECPLLNFSGASCDSGVSSTNRINGVTQLAVGMAAWVFGAIDAPRAARRENERMRNRVSVALFLREGLAGQPAFGIGVTLGW